MTPPTPFPTPDRPASADWIEVAIQWASGTAAVGMFAYGVALSYAVLHAVAAAADLPGWAARLWPLGFEAFMASAALNALAEQRHRRHVDGWRQRVPWYPWTLTGLTAGGSILLNWFHPAIPLDPPPGWLVSLVYGLPPLIAVFAWHLFLQRVAHRRHPIPVRATAVPATAVPLAVPRPAKSDPHQDREAGTVVAGPAPPPIVPAGGPTPPTTRTPTRPAAGAGRPGLAAPQPAGTIGAREAGLLAQARAVAAEHQHTHGRPISRDALRQALRVSNQTAGALLRGLRAGGPAVGAGELSDGTAPAAAAGNGVRGRPAHLAAPVPAVSAPGPAGDGQGVARDV
jgi:hypothetical protein